MGPGFPCMKWRTSNALLAEAMACTLAAISAHGGNLGVQMAQEGPCTHGAEESLGLMIQFIRRATEGHQHWALQDDDVPQVWPTGLIDPARCLICPPETAKSRKSRA